MAMPEILIIDALSLRLARVVVQKLVETLKVLKAAGLIVLPVERNLHLALALSVYAYANTEGWPVLEGLCGEVAARSEIRQAYLGL